MARKNPRTIHPRIFLFCKLFYAGSDFWCFGPTAFSVLLLFTNRFLITHIFFTVHAIGSLFIFRTDLSTTTRYFTSILCSTSYRSNTLMIFVSKDANGDASNDKWKNQPKAGPPWVENKKELFHKKIMNWIILQPLEVLLQVQPKAVQFEFGFQQFLKLLHRTIISY